MAISYRLAEGWAMLFQDARKEMLERVEELLAKGYRPQGGICIHKVTVITGLPETECVLYSQAMFLEE